MTAFFTPFNSKTLLFRCPLHNFKARNVVIFYRATTEARHAMPILSVCPSICHTRDLGRNGEANQTTR